VPLQHLRQLRTLRTTWIVHVVCNLLWTLGCQFIEPINELCITATLLDETVKPVTTIAPKFVATHADKVAEDGCAVAGHFDRHVNIRNYTCPTRVGLYGIKVRVFSQRQRM
ncbi:MAG: hypothetical protein WCB78_24430, partial [Pseudolabrys sp.]